MPEAADGLIVEEVRALRGLCPEWAEPGRILWSRGHELLESEGLGPPWRHLGSFPAAKWKRLASGIRPGRRLLRQFFYNVLPLSDGSLFITFDRDVALWKDGAFRSLPGREPAARVLRGGCALSNDGTVTFGDYRSNPERGDIHLYRYSPRDESVERIATLPKGAVRHVHGVYRDPYGDSLWCTTGDRGPECRILRSYDGCRTFEEIGSGDEGWRCVSLLFDEDAVYFGTDAEYQPNHLVRLDRASGERRRLAQVGGPVYYSAAAAGLMLFGVTAEGCPGQEEDVAELWCLQGERARRLAAYAKDPWPHGLFLPGTLHFPAGPGLEGEVLFHTVAAADGRTFRVRRAASGGGPAARREHPQTDRKDMSP